MKIVYDARWILTEDRFDGVSRYSHELAWALSRQKDIDLTFLIHDKAQLEKLPKKPHLLLNAPSDIRKELRVARKINQLDPDVVYSPFFIMGTNRRKYKLILTVHDLIYFTHRTPPQWLPSYVRIAWRFFHISRRPMRWILNHADAVATVSETAKRELQKRSITKRDIHVVRNAVSDKFKPLKKIAHHDSKDIVYMGAFTPYKNVELLIDAMQYLPGIKLHLLSKIPFKRRKVLEKSMRDKGVFEQIVIHNGVSDRVYNELLENSRCLVTASRLEGFGLPIIEAQQKGVPVVCADTEIFREVGGNSVLFFDVNSAEDCAEQIKKLADRKTSEKIISSGLENVKGFNWEDSAKEAVNICKKVS